MSKIFIHIGARKSSKGLTNKNIKLFMGKPLIVWTIEHAQKVKNVYKIIVSTDCKKIIKICSKLKVDIIIKRPKILSGSTASKFLVWKHSVEYLFNKKEILKEDLFLDLDCTCPRRNLKDTNLMINKFFNFQSKKNFDGLFTITPAKKNPYFNLVEKNKHGFLIISKKNKSKTFTSRQQSPKVYEHVANAYALKPSFLMKEKSLMDGKIYGHEIKSINSHDIDSKFDFEIAKKIFRLKNYA